MNITKTTDVWYGDVYKSRRRRYSTGENIDYDSVRYGVRSILLSSNDENEQGRTDIILKKCKNPFFQTHI